MKIFHFTLLFLTAVASHAEETIRLWPDSVPGEPTGFSIKEEKAETGKDGTIRISNVSAPELVRFPAPGDKRTGTCVVVCPGGGYSRLAWNKEGTEIATWLNALGVEALVLKYRVPRRDSKTPHPGPLMDVQRAIRIARQNAKAWNMERIGVMGFSAGGHLSVMACSYGEELTYPKVDDADKLSAAPDFQILIYPAYLGSKSDNAHKLDPLVKVDKKTPPAFIAITHDDSDRALFAALYYAELNRNNVPSELHIYNAGGHGYGMRPSKNPVTNWPDRLREWLHARGLLNKSN